MKIATLIDHTLLRTDASAAAIEQLCLEAREYGFCSVCLNPYWVPLAVRRLSMTAVKIGTVVGFPLGANQPAIKIAEASQALADGASEIDMVLNVGAVKSDAYDVVRGELEQLASACRSAGALSKLILETHLLTEAEQQRTCELAIEAGLDFVKTATGFAGGGATTEDVARLSRWVKPHGLGVKASGGIRSLAVLQQMLAAGATRIGTSSGVAILREAAGQAASPTPEGY